MTFGSFLLQTRSESYFKFYYPCCFNITDVLAKSGSLRIYVCFTLCCYLYTGMGRSLNFASFYCGTDWNLLANKCLFVQRWKTFVILSFKRHINLKICGAVFITDGQLLTSYFRLASATSFRLRLVARRRRGKRMNAFPANAFFESAAGDSKQDGGRPRPARDCRPTCHPHRCCLGDVEDTSTSCSYSTDSSMCREASKRPAQNQSVHTVLHLQRLAARQQVDEQHRLRSSVQPRRPACRRVCRPVHKGNQLRPD